MICYHRERMHPQRQSRSSWRNLSACSASARGQGVGLVLRGGRFGKSHLRQSLGQRGAQVVGAQRGAVGQSQLRQQLGSGPPDPRTAGGADALLDRLPGRLLDRPRHVRGDAPALPAPRRRPRPTPRGSCRTTASRTTRATRSPHDMRESRCASRSLSWRNPCSHGDLAGAHAGGLLDQLALALRVQQPGGRQRPAHHGPPAAAKKGASTPTPDFCKIFVTGRSSRSTTRRNR